MPINVPCPTCKARLKAPDAAAGRTFACPGCQTRVTLPRPAPQPRPTPPAPVFDDLEIIEDEPTPAPTPAAPPPPAASGDEVVTDYEELDEAELIEEEEPILLDDIEELEEVGGKRRKPKLGWSKVLRSRQVHVRPKKSGAAVANPESGRDLARVKVIAPERRKDRPRAEVREGRDDELLLTVGGPVPAAPDSDDPAECLQILGPDDRLLGTYPPVSWQSLRSCGVWIQDELGRRTLKLQPEPAAGRCALLAADGHEVGEVVTADAYEGRARPAWFRPGDDAYVAYKREMESRLEDKLRLLGVVLGIALLDLDED